MTHEFDAVITEGRGGGGLVEIPFSVQETHGTRGQVRVLEYARWIADAKREDTRQRRLDKALEKLRRGERL